MSDEKSPDDKSPDTGASPDSTPADPSAATPADSGAAGPAGAEAGDANADGAAPDTAEPATDKPHTDKPATGEPATDDLPAMEVSSSDSASSDTPPESGTAAGSSDSAEPGDPTTDELIAQRGFPPPGAPARRGPGEPPTHPFTKELPPDAFAPIDDPMAAPPLAGAPLAADQAAGDHGVVRTKPSPKRKWRTAALITAAVVLLGVIAGVGTELYIRHKVTSCLETSFTNLTGTSTSVSIPRGLMLAAWFRGDVAWVQVDTNDSANSTAMRLHARANEVSRDGRSVQSLNGTAFVPYSRVQELADEGASNGEATIEKITGNAAEGTVSVDSTYRVVFVSVPATVVMKPTATGGKVDFAVQKANTFGIGLPNDFAQNIVDQVTDSMFGPLFQQIQVDSLKVTDQGIDFAFSGRDVNLQAASTGAPVSENSSPASC